MRKYIQLGSVLTAVIFLAACKAGGDYQGLEYAPNMYHSVAYEPLTQVTDPEAGKWADALDNSTHGEFYTSNNYNPYKMNLRMPPANTVRRNAHGWLPYRAGNDSVSLRLANKLVNPFEATPEVLDQGKVMFETYCKHCHGAKGGGDGKVAQGVKIDGVEHSSYPGVANLKGDAYKNITEGHIFHVITYGKGLMGSHGSQVSEEDRWKIAKYVKELQKN
jgi:mono/diheme cytochrome c family protein